jgi:hypothetical protein
MPAGPELLTEEAAVFPSFVTAAAQTLIDDLHQQAQRDALARAARRARAHQHGHRAPGLPAVVARWAHRQRDTTGRPRVTQSAPAATTYDTRIQA